MAVKEKDLGYFNFIECRYKDKEYTHRSDQKHICRFHKSDSDEPLKRECNVLDIEKTEHHDFQSLEKGFVFSPDELMHCKEAFHSQDGYT